jgi:dephospho-CoA kinase
VEAALVYESGLDAALNAVIVLRASEETRIRRVMQRDGMDRQQVIARVHAQMNPDRAARRADFVVHNDGSVEELRERVMFLDRLLVLHVAGPRKS